MFEIQSPGLVFWPKPDPHIPGSDVNLALARRRDGGEGTTSGAEEVDRILEDARKKYGRIR